MLQQANMLNRTQAALAFVCGAAALASGNSAGQIVAWGTPTEAAGPKTLRDAIQSHAKRDDQITWQTVFDRRLAAVASLSDGWDGPASVSVSQKVLSNARHLLRLAFAGVAHPAPPAVMPGADGGLELSWLLSSVRFQFEIDSDGTSSAWVNDRISGREEEGDEAQAKILLFRWAGQLTADKFQAT